MFFPDLSINARFSVADGGRVIEFPVGDMLNPVYSTLNLLTGSNQFPDIENQEFTFYRPIEHETKATLIQPIFNPSIYHNYKIKKELVNVENVNIDIYKRELVKEIKCAYFNYLKTEKILSLLYQTIKLLEENVRVTESLFENDKVTVDIVYRSKAELSKIEQEISYAIKHNKVSRSYFNFLLNRPLNSDIIITEANDFVLTGFDVKSDETKAFSNRGELLKIKTYQQISENLVALNRSFYLPDIYGIIDYGFQGAKYSFTGDDDFIMASVVLKWNLFNGFQKESKVKQAIIDQQDLQNRYKEAEQLVTLEVTNACYSLQASAMTIVAAESQLSSASKAFEITNKRFRQGQATLLEFIDARTTKTNADINLIISQFEYQIEYAEYERIIGIYNIN